MLKTYVKVNDGWWMKITEKDLISRTKEWELELGADYYATLTIKRIKEDGVAYVNRVGGQNSWIGEDATEEIQAEDFPKKEVKK
ncbi:hypothetical protein [Carnobacterium maltaromaticum]|uniref:hypothetical protein n=1 Tax=Carnobacterium maltaromaticum TaxID=2751 RepID=UPI0039AF5CA7